MDADNIVQSNQACGRAWGIRELPFSSVIILGLSLFSAILAGGFTVGYLFSANETVQEAGRRLFAEREKAIEANLQTLFLGPQFLTVGLRDAAVLQMGEPQRAEATLLSALDFYPWVVNIKIGDERGVYFTTSRIAEVPDTRYYTPPPGAKYAVVTLVPGADGTFKQIAEFRDADFSDMGGRSESPSANDVRQIDWYQLGRDVGSNLGWKGNVVPGGVGARISFVVGFEGAVRGSIAVDIGHRDIAQVLERVRGSESEHLVVFDDAGIRYGSTGFSGDGDTIDPTDAAIADALYGRFAESGTFEGANIEANNETYFATVMPIALRREMDVRLFAGIATSRAQLQAPLQETLRSVLVLIGVTLLLALPVFYLVSRKLSEPLRSLRGLAEDTLRLNFADAAKDKSMITEVRDLTQSFLRTQAAFRNICLFVPEAHIKRTIDSGSATVFGERRIASMLMTDVTGFTTIIEHMEPEALLWDMSEYFDKLNSAILEERGTIDKYVGDAIFSYWNGVDDEPEHVSLCCRASLRMRMASEALADKWRAEGKHPWATRIGLHCGDVVVGNVGSERRMDFTVIGNAVNLASRLEGLNKFYGTEILASNDVRRQAGDGFVFRSIDLIRPKGIYTPLEIHELIGLRDADGSLPVADQATLNYCEAWERALRKFRQQAWDEALNDFRALLEERPDDGPAQLYVTRCEHYRIAPPPGDWDGVVTYDEK